MIIMKITRKELRKLINEAGKNYFPRKAHVHRSLLKHISPVLEYYSSEVKFARIGGRYGASTGIYITLMDGSWLTIIYDPRRRSLFIRASKQLAIPDDTNYVDVSLDAKGWIDSNYVDIDLDSKGSFDKVRNIVRGFIGGDFS